MTSLSKTYDEASRMLRHLTDVRSWAVGSGASAFTGLALPLVSLMPGNPDFAQQLYHGQFAFAGRTVACQPSQVFSVAAPDPAWSEALHGFTWLRHLEASGLTLHRAFARSLFQSWCTQSRTASCRRLMSLSRHAGFMLADAGAEFETQFLGAVTREAVNLRRLRPAGGAEQLQQAIALLTATLAFRGGDAMREAALARTAELAAQVILPDGGHIDRSPKSLLELVADLVPLRAALEAQRIAIPQGLNAALERAMPMLRMLCHRDGGLAVFHGVEPANADLVRAVFERDKVAGKPLLHAPHSGYVRMAQGATTVIIDCGAPALCDSTLAFEFSDGPQRLVGSCGMPADASPQWRAAAASRAAHSAVEFGGEEQRISTSRRLRQAPAAAVTAELLATHQGLLLQSRNGGHCRDFFLAAGGHDFRGEDRFDQRRPFTIRFHLHSLVKASPDRRGGSIMLVLPSRAAWQFEGRGGTLTLEDSICLASGSGPRRSHQIVMRGDGSLVNWAFRKLDRKARVSAEAAAAPQLPF